MSSSIDYDGFVAQLLKVVPELEPVQAEHLKDNDELLPHVLLGDITRFAIWAHSDKQDEILERLLGFIEQSLGSSDPRVLELVVVSFIENLHQAGTDMETLRKRLGPRSKKCLDAIG